MPVYGYLAYWADDLSTVPWNHLTHIALFAAEAETDGSLTGSGTLISTKGRPADNTAGFQRFEFEATTTSPADAQVSDLSSFIHCAHKPDAREPWSGGYFFQFGGRYNTVTQLTRGGESLRISSDTKITPRRAI